MNARAAPHDTAPPVLNTSAVDALGAGATKALAAFAAFTQADVDHIVKKASVAALNKHGELARLAVAETGRGMFDAMKDLMTAAFYGTSLQDVRSRRTAAGEAASSAQEAASDS